MSTNKNGDSGCCGILIYLALIIAIAKIFKVLFYIVIAIIIVSISYKILKRVVEVINQKIKVEYNGEEFEEHDEHKVHEETEIYSNDEYGQQVIPDYVYAMRRDEISMLSRERERDEAMERFMIECNAWLDHEEEEADYKKHFNIDDD